MIYVVLKILQVLGIILLVLLGIALLLLCLVLLVPVRYTVTGEIYPKERDDRTDSSGGTEDTGISERAHAEGRVSWLFRRLRLDFSYDRRGVQYQVRAAGFRLLDSAKAEGGGGSV